MQTFFSRLFKKTVINRNRNFLDVQIENRFRNYTVFCIVGMPTMLIFSFINLLGGNTLLWMITLLCFAGLLIGWFMLYWCVGGWSVFRFNSLLFCLLLTYMAYLGGAGGSKILWAYIFPMVTFFLLGKVEGTVWCSMFFLSCQLFLWNPWSFDFPYNYSSEFALRFSLSFTFIAVMTYTFERFRQAHRTQIEGKNRLLEEEVSNRHNAESALRKSEEQYRTVFYQASEGIILLDETGTIMETNPPLDTALGFPVDGLLGKNIFDLMHPDDLIETPSQIPLMASGQNVVIERRLETLSGEYLLFELSGRMIEDSRILLVCRDITERKAAEIALAEANRKLDYLAHNDGLTKIFNRRRFDFTLAQEWKRMNRENNSLTLVLCDIDYFKQFNDRYGHPVGDACLITIAQILSESLHRPADIAARFGGEEFVLLLPMTSSEGGVKIAERIRKKIIAQRIPHDTSSIAPFVTMSFGVGSVVPHQKEGFDDLVAITDQALYQAKANGRNRVELADNVVP